MSTRLEVLGLQVFARPPRILLVTPGGERWAAWAGRGLLALSPIWGGCASAVVPADVVDDPSLGPLLRAFQPDHVLPLQPLWSMEEAAFLRESKASPNGNVTEPRKVDTAWMQDEPYVSASFDETQAAATRLGARLGSMHVDGDLQVHSLGGANSDVSEGSGLTARADVGPQHVWGVPSARLSSLNALAAALTFGAQSDDPFGPVTDADWVAALLDNVEGRSGPSRLSRSLAKVSRDDVPEDKAAIEAALSGLPLLDPAASACISLRRGLGRSPRLVIVGSEPADMALAGLCRRVLGSGVWLPEALDDPQIVHRLLRAAPRPRGTLIFTSASVPIEGIQQRLEAAKATRPDLAGVNVRPLAESALGHTPEPRGAYVAGPRDLDLAGRYFVALADGADERVPLAAEVGPNDEMHATLPFPLRVPPGLDADVHSWLVTVIANGRPVPPHRSLNGTNLLREDANQQETFVKSSDGGITFWSHRWDFVPSGALLGGKLASPAFAWPTARRLLEVAANPIRVQVSDAGQRATVAERLLGSRQAVEELAAGAGWHLAQAFLEPTPGGLKKGDFVQLHQKGGSFMSWAGIQALTVDGWAPADRAILRDDWTRQGVLRRGLVLGCEHCPTVEFYPLREVLQTYLCRRCGGDNALTEAVWTNRPGDLQEPRWYFDLHPAVADLVRNHGDVPLLSSAFLRTRLWADPIVFPEFTLESNGSPFVELDFAVGSVDGLWVGEAKSVSRLGRGASLVREFNKLLKGVEALDATGLVLATSKPRWAATTLEAVKAELDQRLSAGKHVPVVLQLTHLGSPSPELSTIAGRRVERL